VSWTDRQRAEWLASPDADAYFEALEERRTQGEPERCPRCGRRCAELTGDAFDVPCWPGPSRRQQLPATAEPETVTTPAAAGTDDTDHDDIPF
jgi:hypothetical protein